MHETRREKTPVEFFDTTASEYAHQHYEADAHSFMRNRHARILEFLEGLSTAVTPLEVLDAGCGPGFLVQEFARRGWGVTAMDAAPGMLREARSRIDRSDSGERVSYSCGSIDLLPFRDDSFDLVCSTGVIEYLPADEPVLAEFARVMRPGGRLILSVTNDSAPSLALDSAIEALKRSDAVRSMFNSLWTRLGKPPARPRHFHVRRHQPRRFSAALGPAGFEVVRDGYFHYLPWPRPLDKAFPRVTAQIGRRMEALLPSTKLRGLGEGYVVLARKADQGTANRDHPSDIASL